MDPFAGSDTFTDKKFTGLSLTGITVSGKEFDGCAFEKCIFIECVFELCRFTDCTFSGCSVSAAKPYNSSFLDVSFRDSKIMGIDWTRAKSIRFLSFERCDISFSNFSALRAPGLKMTGCIARETGFSDADLSKGNFRKTDFYGAVFSHTNLTGADFTGAFNYGIDITANNMKKALFSLPEAASLLRSLDIILKD